MSLINQMLKDLEQRRRRPAASETNTLKDVPNNRVQIDKQLIRKYALWGVGAVDLKRPCGARKVIFLREGNGPRAINFE